MNAAFPLYAGAQHGYSAVLTAPPGHHQVCVYAINVSGTGFNRSCLGCVTVTVAPAGHRPPSTVAPVPAPTTTTVAPRDHHRRPDDDHDHADSRLDPHDPMI